MSRRREDAPATPARSPVCLRNELVAFPHGAYIDTMSALALVPLLTLVVAVVALVRTRGASGVEKANVTREKALTEAERGIVNLVDRAMRDNPTANLFPIILDGPLELEAARRLSQRGQGSVVAAGSAWEFHVERAAVGANGIFA